MGYTQQIRTRLICREKMTAYCCREPQPDAWALGIRSTAPVLRMPARFDDLLYGSCCCLLAVIATQVLATHVGHPAELKYTATQRKKHVSTMMQREDLQLNNQTDAPKNARHRAEREEAREGGGERESRYGSDSSVSSFFWKTSSAPSDRKQCRLKISQI